VPRLLRPLVVAVGVLIALAGGAVGATTVFGHRASTPMSPDALPLPSPSAGAGGTTATTPTTVLSPLERLAAKLDAALALTNSCLVVEDATGSVLYQHQPDTPLMPASTQKLLVAAAALSTLGPNFQFVTQVVAPVPPVAGQVANLWLVGAGDPLLATPEAIAMQTNRPRVAGYPWTPLAGLADRLAAAGIRQVPGGIRGDDSHLDRLRFLPVWPAADRSTPQIGLISALSVNEGVQATTPKVTLAQDPPAFAASELGRLLTQRHVVVGPPGADQVAPATAVVVATVASAPLSQMVESMIRASDNWIAELLVRQLDRAAGGTGTTAGGLAVVMRQAAALGLPMAGVQMDDGSGLSHTNRATCRELLAALDLGDKTGLTPIMTGLATAGQTGTLAARFVHTPTAGKLRAKTGSIQNAGGMVGVLSVGPVLRFAYLTNQPAPDSGLYAQEDQAIAILSTYPDVTPPAKATP
jgi:D-alanyl-D-alanine carboxypeptidase/D-alanyl-D-alanine-endopeptidase (penicillin-binding protein 4)